MVGPIRSASDAVWRLLLATAHPEGNWDAEGLRAFEREGHEGNARLWRWTPVVAVPGNTFVAAMLLRRPEEAPGGAASVCWLVGFNALLTGLVLAGAVVAWRGRPAALWRALGDVMGVVSLFGAAVRSADAQRAHAHINVFILAALATAFFLRMRPAIFAPALLGSGALVLAGIAHFRGSGPEAAADAVAVIAAAVLSLFGFFVARSTRADALRARRRAELVNADLERRVEAAVGEVVQHARAIDELNRQLDQKVRERSQELSRALARLAEGHRALEPGAVLGGRFEIEAWIGQGGMGVVYRGRDRVTGKAVAVKVVQAGSVNQLDALHRFLREARAMSSVTHPAVVRSIHVDVSEDGRLFQAMELVVGETLAARLARAGALPPEVAARLVGVLAGAVAAAHAAGVVHRDVKPSNVMLTTEAPGLKLLDFGISKLREAPGEGTDGGFLGTPEFVSPEQVSAPASVAAPTDVYALGLVLYLCVANRMPFDVEPSRSWLLAHAVSPPAELSSHAPGVDRGLARVAMECLSKKPGDRPTAPEVAARLTAIADAAGTPPLEALALALPSARVAAEAGTTADATVRSSDDRGLLDAPEPTGAVTPLGSRGASRA